MIRRVLLICVFLVVTLAPIMALADEKPDHICFRVLDANKDGRVTRDEFRVYYPNGEALFGKADVNQDGTLTHDEYHRLLGHGAS